MKDIYRRFKVTKITGPHRSAANHFSQVFAVELLLDPGWPLRYEEHCVFVADTDRLFDQIGTQLGTKDLDTARATAGLVFTALRSIMHSEDTFPERREFPISGELADYARAIDPDRIPLKEGVWVEWEGERLVQSLSQE